MDSKLRATYKQAVEQALSQLREREADVLRLEPRMWFTRPSPNQWQGRGEQVPTIGPGILSIAWQEMATELAAEFRAHYPDYEGLVGTATFGGRSAAAHEQIMRIACEVWRRTRSFDASDTAIEAVLDDVAHFLDSPEVEIAFIAPLLNFSAPWMTDPLPLMPGLVIGRLSEDEVSEIFGREGYGPSHLARGRFGPVEYALNGTIREPKILGSWEGTGVVSAAPLRDLLDGAVRALRTFRSAPIGYEFVRLRTARFSPFLSGEITQTYSGAYIPIASYDVPESDCDALLRHAGFVTRGLHSSLDSACDRLADASIRIKARDKLFDAVVGLEAILLADTSEQYRGELRYRFAMNFAALETPRSIADFRFAQRLYDLRSTISHGGRMPESVRLEGGVEANPMEVANRACEALRRLIDRFLPQGQQPPYTHSEYWLNLHFPAPDRSSGDS